MLKRSPMRWLALAAGASLLVAACGSSDNGASSGTTAEGSTSTETDGTEAPSETDGTAAPAQGGTLTVASNTPVAVWDLASSTAGETSAIAYPLVYGWYMREIDGELVPDLLESAVPSDDLMTWTLTLRSGMVFSDGTPVTSEDLKFSLDLRAADPTYAYTIGSPSPDDIVIVDDLTVEMTVPAPNNEIVTLGLAAASENLYPADFGGRTAEEYFLDPIGAGPFVIESNSDSGITFAKNDLYWDAENIALDAVEIVIAPDPNAKLVGFESGDFDIITRQSTSVVDQLDAAGTALVVDPSANVDAVFLNGATAPFDDVNFRRAVWYGIDRTTIADGVFDGLAIPAEGMIPSAVPGATPGANPPDYDPELAAEFLAASAYADDASFDLALIDGDGARRDEAQVIADQLAEIGITVNVTPVGFAEWSDLVLVTQGHQATLYGYETVVTPASDIIGFFATTAGFFGGFDTTNAFGQFAAIQAAPDVAGQSAVIEEFETEFGEMAYAVPVVEPLWVLGVADGVTGLVVPPTGFPDVAYVSLAG